MKVAFAPFQYDSLLMIPKVTMRTVQVAKSNKAMSDIKVMNASLKSTMIQMCARLATEVWDKFGVACDFKVSEYAYMIHDDKIAVASDVRMCAVKCESDIVDLNDPDILKYSARMFGWRYILPWMPDRIQVYKEAKELFMAHGVMNA